MAQALAAPDLAVLEKKLDSLAAEVRYLTEEAELASRRRQERAELVHDVVPLANDAFTLVTRQLEEVQGYVDLNDLLRLLKRLLRNGRNLEKMLDQLESVMDLVQTAGPLVDDAFEKATDLLQAADEKGYFIAARKGAYVVDGLVTSLCEEGDCRSRDVSLWTLVRQMRDPDVRRGLATVMQVLKLLGAQDAQME